MDQSRGTPYYAALARALRQKLIKPRSNKGAYNGQIFSMHTHVGKIATVDMEMYVHMYM